MDPDRDCYSDDPEVTEGQCYEHPWERLVADRCQHCERDADDLDRAATI